MTRDIFNVYDLINARDSLAIEAVTDWLRASIENEDANRWAAGDVLDTLETTYGDGNIRDIASGVGRSASTLYDWRRVASTFYGDARARIFEMDNVSWSHCADAAKRSALQTVDKKLEWLEEVSMNGYSVDHARRILKERHGSEAKPRYVWVVYETYTDDAEPLNVIAVYANEEDALADHWGKSMARHEIITRKEAGNV